MSIRKVGIIGHFGGNENILDGQTIKTKILCDELKKSSKWELVKVDTYYKSRNPLKLLIDTLKCLKSAQDIIVLLSRNGMKVYFPLLYFCKMIYNKRIYHDVIGGNLYTYVERYPKFVKYLNSFEVNWVETYGLKKKLENQGIINCAVIPNFKRLNIAELKIPRFEEPFEFCIFSRVMKEKGIEIAIETIESINKEGGKIICKLDIYGRIDNEYKKKFEGMLQEMSNAIAYKGMIPYEQSVEAIRDYYALLFPTYWDGEGFPGTIVDAFSAGIPVIATDWNCNGEIVENEKNGILYPNSKVKNLKEAIEWLIKHKEDMQELKKNCLESARKYQPDRYIEQIIKEIEQH